MEEKGFIFETHVETAYELREVLGEALDEIIDLYVKVNSRIHEDERRQAAFIRYCFTGKFD